MIGIELPDLSGYIADWSVDLDDLRQNDLLRESQFLSFAQDRGIRVNGVVFGEPGELHRKGWLRCDSINDDDLYFHPFRLYALQRLLPLSKADKGLIDKEMIDKQAARYSTIVDLAILSEPVYWPRITGQVRARSFDDNTSLARHAHWRRIEALLKALDPATWCEIHEQLRRDAACLDDNTDLYVLMRVSKWQQRERLKGPLSGALWLRHLAEVIRRGFEDVHGVEWLEEDWTCPHF